MIENKKDKKAAAKWMKSNVSLTNYINFIDKKVDRYELDFIDLLYISNFK